MKQATIIGVASALVLTIFLVQESHGDAEFAIPWHAFAGGGGHSEADGFTLTATIGQPEAGTSMAAGAWSLDGGFWSAPAGPPPPNPADIDGDGSVGFSDLLIVLSSWGSCPAPPAECPADIDDDGVVGFSDLLIVLSAWDG